MDLLRNAEKGCRRGIRTGIKRVTGKRLRQRFLDDMQCTSPWSLEKTAARIVIRKAEH